MFVRFFMGYEELGYWSKSFLCLASLIVILSACTTVQENDPNRVQSADVAQARGANFSERLQALDPAALPNFGVKGDLDRYELEAVWAFAGLVPVSKFILNGEPPYEVHVERVLLQSFESSRWFRYDVELRKRSEEVVIFRSSAEGECSVSNAYSTFPPECNEVHPDILLQALLRL